jgi:hypothetical protein
MNNNTKILIGLGVTGISAAGYIAYRRIKEAQKKIILSVDCKLISLTKQGIKLHLSANIKNPSNGQMTIKHPYVNLSFRGARIAQSTMQDKYYQLKPFDEVNIEEMEVNIPATGLFTLGAALYSAFILNTPVLLTGLFATRIITPFGGIPFQTTKNFSVKY